VIGRHALRNALLPIITVLGLDVGNYLTGSILTERYFPGPGWGDTCLWRFKNAISGGPGQPSFLVLIFVLVNLLTDVLYAKADPRVAYD